MAPFQLGRIRTAKRTTGVAMFLGIRVALLYAKGAPYDLVPSRDGGLALFWTQPWWTHPRFRQPKRWSRHGFRNGLFCYTGLFCDGLVYNGLRFLECLFPKAAIAC